jgi:cytochrome c oxidase subunit 2
VLDPQAKIVAGFPPTMPPFRGQISDAEIDEIVAYIKSLKD